MTTTTTVPGGSTTSTTIVDGTTTTIMTSTTSTTLVPGGACGGLSGLARARCRIDAALAEPLCGADPVPATLDRALRARLQTVAARLDSAAGAEGRKRVRLLKKARGALGGVGRSAAAAAKTKRAAKRISPACKTTLEGLVDAVAADLR